VIVVTPYLVRPVNAADIKLPTDGLQNPSTMQEVVGNMLTDGKSGAVRPGPVSGDNAAPPRVGLSDPAAAAPAPLSKREAKALAKARASAPAEPSVPAPASPKGDAQAPGFSLN
jgi:pilus assembly protein CpaC